MTYINKVRKKRRFNCDHYRDGHADVDEILNDPDIKKFKDKTMYVNDDEDWEWGVRKIITTPRDEDEEWLEKLKNIEL
jgi:hypothetical protein